MLGLLKFKSTPIAVLPALYCSGYWMAPISGYPKYDLRPWLIAKVAKISVIFPFNDSASVLDDQIAALLSQFLPNLHAIILVDSRCSLNPSAVQTILTRYGHRIHLIQKDPDDSPGVSLLEGFRYALDTGSGNIIQLTQGIGEFTGALLDMLSFANQYDLVIGSRFLEQQEFICPQKQAQYNLDLWLHGFLLKNLLGGSITDGTSGVRCWSRVALEFILTRLRLRNPRFLNLEMAYLSYKNKLSVIEFPIAYHPTVRQPRGIPDNSPYHG